MSKRCSCLLTQRPREELFTPRKAPSRCKSVVQFGYRDLANTAGNPPHKRNRIENLAFLVEVKYFETPCRAMFNCVAVFDC